MRQSLNSALDDIVDPGPRTGWGAGTSGFGLRAWPLALVGLWQDDVDLVSLMS